MTVLPSDDAAHLDPIDPDPSTAPLLEVRNLAVRFPTEDGILTAVDDVSFVVERNEVVGIVGESGSGKTVTSMAILGLLPGSARAQGEVWFRGEQILHSSEGQLRRLRGDRIAMVFQDALAAFNPVYPVGMQIGEAIRAHRDVDKSAARERTLELLDLVGIANPARQIDQYPHEYSGGMRQRAMIAMAIANDPDLLIADEPTTALDVTIQAQVLDVLERVQARTKSAILLITHDLGVVAGMADRVMVMYAGAQSEIGTVDEIFYEARHPYTLGLLASLPRVDVEARGGRLYRIQGQPPSLTRAPSGCPFHPRCFRAELPEPCARHRPPFAVVGPSSHRAACHFAADMAGVTADDLRAEMSK